MKVPKSHPKVVTVKHRTPNWSKAEEYTLRGAYESNVSLNEIIRILGRSEGVVRRKIESMGLTRPDRYSTPKRAFFQRRGELTAPTPKAYVDPDSPWERVQAAIPGRARRLSEGFILDGQKAGFYDCIRAANRRLKSLGQPQITGSPEWGQ